MVKRIVKGVTLGTLLVAVNTLCSRDSSGGKVHISANLINVRDYGARGNGLWDDTAAIQKALDAAAKLGGASVYFPKGTYLVQGSKTLRVSSGTTLYGEGSASVIKASPRTFGWEMMRLSGHDIEIRNLALDGNQQVNRVLVIGGGSSRITLTRLVVSNAAQSKDKNSDYYSGVIAGIVVYGDTQTIRISDIEVKNVVARNLSEGSMVARGIYVTTTWGSRELPAHDVEIRDSHIHHIGPADDGDGLYVEDPHMDSGNGHDMEVRIINNTFDHCAKRAIKIYAEGIEVEGNRIINSYLNDNYFQGTQKGKLAPDMYAAISVYGSSNSVMNNIIEGKGSFYAAIEAGDGETVRDISIKGNTVVMGARSSIQGTTSIRLGNIEEFTIANNTLRHGERGIWTWQNAKDGLIQNNDIQMSQGGGIDLTTYLPGYFQQDIQVLGNRISARNFRVQLGPTNCNVVVK